MKKIQLTSLFVFVTIMVFSQSYPVAVDDTIDVEICKTYTINVTNNDYHPDGEDFWIDNIFIGDEYVASTDSTITFYLNYMDYYNLCANHPIGYRLRDETGLYGSESIGKVHLNFVNEYYDSLDINNIKASVFPYGSQFWKGPWHGLKDIYEFPKGSGKHTILTSTFWVGGIDQNNQLRLSAERYRQVGADYWAGPICNHNDSISIDTNSIANWHRVWKITREEIEYHKHNWNKPDYTPVENITNWPAHGDTTLFQNYYLAPFVDIDGDGNYNSFVGDYPLIKGDQCIFYIFNDLIEKQPESTGRNPIGIEIHGMMYQFYEPENPAFNNTVFMNYKIFNRSSHKLSGTYIGIWSDIDLGYARDDYVGCDVERGMYFGYNGKEIDGYGEDEAYGEDPPSQGVVFLGGPYKDSNNYDDPDGECDEGINGIGFGDSLIDNERLGMTRFVFFNNASGTHGDPGNAVDSYNYLKGIWKDGTTIKYGGGGHSELGSYGPDCHFMFPDLTDPCLWGTNGIEPNGLINWTEETALNGGPTFPEDRRGLGSTGPFTFLPNSMHEIDIAYVTARGDDGPLSSVDLLKVYVDSIKSRYIKNPDNFGNQLLGTTETESQTHSLKIYPNPAQNLLNVQYDHKNNEAYYAIYDVYGRVLIIDKVDNPGRFSININSLRRGIYIVSVVENNRKFVGRLIKE